jgi:hypothetical protein
MGEGGQMTGKQSSLWGCLFEPPWPVLFHGYVVPMSLCVQVFILSPSEDIPLWHNQDINRE